MKIIYHILAYLLLMATVSVFTGCEDRFPEVNPVIGEGLSRVEVKVSYEPFVTSLESRTAGDAVKSVESLYLFFYDSEQQLVKDASLFPNGYIDLSGIRFSNTNNDRPSGEPENTTSAETNTPTGTFTFNIPYGRYYLYLVANTDISDWKEDENYGTVGQLLHNRVIWSGYQNNSAGTPNQQMLGCIPP